MNELSNATIKSVGEVSLRYIKNSTRLIDITITQSHDAFTVFKHIFDPETICHHEQMYALYLSRNNQVLGYALISSGGISSTLCDPRMVFQVALQLNASAVIMAHNHPSGNLEPSKTDIQLTKRLKNAASLLDITLLDHLILSDKGYTSMADEGAF